MLNVKRALNVRNNADSVEILFSPNEGLDKSPGVQLTGMFNGHAFYEALSFRAFNALKSKGVIERADKNEFGTQTWIFKENS